MTKWIVEIVPYDSYSAYEEVFDSESAAIDYAKQFQTSCVRIKEIQHDN